MDLDGIHFDEADRLFLTLCRRNGGEIQIVTVREGVAVEDGAAIHAHAQTMVERGYLDRLIVSGSKARMQGAQLMVTFRARPVALALIDLLERAEVLEAELAALRPQSKRSRSRAARPVAVSTG